MRTSFFPSFLYTLSIVACLHLPVRAVGSPANDNFASATVLSGQSGSVSGNNTGATAEVNEPSFIADLGTGLSIWWRWTAPEAGRFIFDTADTGKETIMGIYTGTSLADLTEVGVHSGFEDVQKSEVAFNAEAGTDYFIVVDLLSAVDAGSITLNWMLRQPPTLNAPTMVYSYRQVDTSQGVFGGGPYEPRSSSVTTGLLVRGRKTEALEQDRAEFGPAALVRYYSVREGGVLKKYYSVAKGIPSVSAGIPGHFESQLVRLSSSSTGVYEVAGFLVTYDDGGMFSSGNLTGKATLSKITPSQLVPAWFAKKLVGSDEGYVLDPSSGAEFVQTQPLPGYYYKGSVTLTFNPTETKAVNFLDFDEALAVVIARLEAKGYVLYE